MGCGITDTLFGRKAKPAESGLNALPDYAQGAYQDLINRAQGVSNTTTPFAPVPFNPTQQAAFNYLGGGVKTPDRPFMGMAQNDYTNATNALGNVSGYLNNASGYLQDASGNINKGVNPITGEEIGTNIGYFMNPYTNDVVNSAVMDINRNADQQNTAISNQASNAGAFGSTRQALMQSELGRNQMLDIGNVSGQLRSAGFQNASNLALNKLQNERSNFLTGAGLNLNQAGTAVNQANTGISQANAYTNNANGEVNAKNVLNQIQQSQANAQLGVGNTMNQYQTATNQIPLQQLQYLAQILQSLPGTQQGQAPATSGLLGKISGYIGNMGGADKVSSAAAMM